MKSLIGWLAALGALGTGVFMMTRSGGGGRLSGSVRRRRGRGLRGHAEVSSLKLFIDNDGDLYRQQTTPIHKNLITKMAKGIYDPAKAEKLWMFLVDNGAKKYAREAGSGSAWHNMFSIADRREVARELNRHFVTEAKIGNYDHLLPKKYQRRA